MVNFARLIMQYRCLRNVGWTGEGNLGDCIQNLAVRGIYARTGILDSDLIKVNRDDINTYDGKKCALVMQGWYGDYMGTFPLPWSDKISPIFIGFHLNKCNGTRERFVREGIHEKMKHFAPIGCRDRNTRDFLRGLGVDAYFSGCMTLTFEKRDKEPENGKIFIVDVRPSILKKLPRKILNQADKTVTHIYYFDQDVIDENTAEQFERDAENVLNKYRTEAKLVITSRIHVAMPCVAMGIPVIFITKNPADERFDVLRGILPVYSKHDIRYINWHPQAANIDELKQKIIQNAVAQITGDKSKQTIQELERITENLKPIEYKPLLIRKIHNLIRKY